MKYKNEELEKSVQLAKDMGFKVWTFVSRTNTIGQVFIDNGDTFGSISALFFGVSYSTCHKANRKSGTGYCINTDPEEATKERIKETLEYSPQWAYSNAVANNIVKETFQQHINNDSILEYIEL